MESSCASVCREISSRPSITPLVEIAELLLEARGTLSSEIEHRQRSLSAVAADCVDKLLAALSRPLPVPDLDYRLFERAERSSQSGLKDNMLGLRLTWIHIEYALVKLFR